MNYEYCAYMNLQEITRGTITGLDDMHVKKILQLQIIILYK